MSAAIDDPGIVAEKQVTTSEEGGAASELALTHGVARDYELKCELSEFFAGALPFPLMFPPFSQQLHARRVRTFFSSATVMTSVTLRTESDSVVISGSSFA